MMSWRILALLVLIWIMSAPVAAQTAAPTAAAPTAAVPARPGSARVTARDLTLNSRLLKREVPYRIFLPPGYEERKNERFPVLYLLHGLTGQFDDWGNRTKLAEYAAGYELIIVMPEGHNGWYTDSATNADDKYESYIIRELIPAIDQNFRTAARPERAIAGLSMGGYGALKFGLKYPEHFVIAGSFSGALDATSWTEKTLGSSWKALTASIMTVYGAEDSRTRKENDLFALVRTLTPEQTKQLPFIYLDCGTEDFLIGQNRAFNALLAEKKIPHEYRELPGAHNWQYWDSQVQEFLRVAQKFIVKGTGQSK